MASMDWAKTTVRKDAKLLSFWIWCVLYQRFDGMCSYLFWWYIYQIHLESREPLSHNLCIYLIQNSYFRIYRQISIKKRTKSPMYQNIALRTTICVSNRFKWHLHGNTLSRFETSLLFAITYVMLIRVIIDESWVPFCFGFYKAIFKLFNLY